MRKIDWKPNGSAENVLARVGCMIMHVYCSGRLAKPKNKSKRRWFAEVFISSQRSQFGPMRKSMDKAKDDAVQISYQILLDHQSCLDAELKKWE